MPSQGRRMWNPPKRSQAVRSSLSRPRALRQRRCLLVVAWSLLGVLSMASHSLAQAPAGMAEFTRGRLVAVIGEEPILAGDLLALVDPQLREIEARVTEEQLEMIREKMMRQVLVQVAQSKMLAQYFIDEQVAGKPIKEREEARAQMDKRVTEAFYEMAVPSMMEKQKVESAAELDQSLRREGTSLAAQARIFKDTMFGQEALKKHVPKKFDIDVYALREYYQDHRGEFERPARARFRELVALFSRSDSPEAAGRLIADMGNEVYLGGASFESVAKRMSHGVTASEGGVYDWLSPGVLKSKKLDEAVFSLPIGRLSAIIEDVDGLRIVEVLEREPARLVPFEEAQLEIRQKLEKAKEKEVRQQFLEKLRGTTALWSRWPEDIPGAKPLNELSLDP